MDHGNPCAIRRIRATSGSMLAALLLAPAGVNAVTATEATDAVADPSTVTVFAERVANLQPASSYAAPATALRYDPRVDLQSRGLPEGQADVSVRGGLFENTGFNIGAAALFDPQTGHYFAELPVDPAMLSAPRILTGIDNALAGFNSTVATVGYDIAPVRRGGDAVLGAGNHDLNFLKLRAAETVELAAAGVIGAAVSYARSRSDGSRPNGDHEFDRLTLQLQHRADRHETHLLYGYQDKFFGWPGAYTGFPSLAETDHTRTHLLMASHRRDSPAGGWWEVAGVLRQLDDDYDFDRTTRERGTAGAFEHKTRSQGISLRGFVPGQAVDWRFAAHALTDELVRSTDLTGGDFSKRHYGKLSLVPEKTWDWNDNRELTLRAGLSVDASSRDANAVLPLAGVALRQITGSATNRLSIEYAATSQVPGYTALKSNPSGLFGGNPDLGRERAKTLSITAEREAAAWYAGATLFFRRDEDLVDWTFLSDAPFARQANALDADVTGLELEFSRQWANLEITGGYTYLHKEEDYESSAVDASFYALNYARHRLNVAVRYQPFSWLDVRLDNELRRQRSNALRTSGDDAYHGALAFGWRTPVQGLRVDLTVDNLTNSNFQDLPGTPPPRRQISLNAGYVW